MNKLCAIFGFHFFLLMKLSDQLSGSGRYAATKKTGDRSFILENSYVNIFGFGIFAVFAIQYPQVAPYAVSFSIEPYRRSSVHFCKTTIDKHGVHHNTIIPEPRTASPSYSAAAWPGVTARWGFSKTTLIFLLLL